MKTLSLLFPCLLSCALVLTGVRPPAAKAQAPVAALQQPQQQQASPQAAEANAALVQGRQLFKRGNAGQALALLEKAEKLFAESGDHKGEAAAHDALGDLYNRQGQYDVALDHYQKAQQSFSAANESYNANLMLAKIGEMYYRRGQINESSGAYSRMSVQKPAPPNPIGTAQAAQSKVNKVKGIFGRVRGIATSTPSASTASSAASTGAEITGEATRLRDAYRQFIIYSTYELGMGRVDYFNNQLDSAKKHFENAL
ncbi:MAG TPA: tetratricopeptide repeat protein, partial [Pyrinomonadaceae bacterium]